MSELCSLALSMADVIERYSTAVDIYSHRRVTPKLSTAYLCFKIILLMANLVFLVRLRTARDLAAFLWLLCSALVLICLPVRVDCSADLRLCIDRCRFLCIEHTSERFGRSDTT